MRYVRPLTMTFDALIDHILVDHKTELRERFGALIRSVEALGEEQEMEELAEVFAHEIGYPLSDEPDVSLVDCELCVGAE